MSDLPFKPGNVMIDYTNHAGVRAVREIVPSFDNPMRWGSTEWHPEEQWLLDALDVAKDDLRTFAVANIHGWYPVRDRQASIDASLAKQLQASMERNGRMRTRLEKLKIILRVYRVPPEWPATIIESIMKDEEPTWPGA